MGRNVRDSVNVGVHWLAVRVGGGARLRFWSIVRSGGGGEESLDWRSGRLPGVRVSSNGVFHVGGNHGSWEKTEESTKMPGKNPAVSLQERIFKCGRH